MIFFLRKYTLYRSNFLRWKEHMYKEHLGIFSFDIIVIIIMCFFHWLAQTMFFF